MTYLGDIEANVNNIRVTHNGEQYHIGRHQQQKQHAKNRKRQLRLQR